MLTLQPIKIATLMASVLIAMVLAINAAGTVVNHLIASFLLTTCTVTPMQNALSAMAQRPDVWPMSVECQQVAVLAQNKTDVIE